MTRPTKEKPRRKRLTAAERRALVLEAGARVFAERGYADASIAEIAELAGIAKSVVYDHFRSKRELHIELLERHVEALLEHVIRPIETDSPEELLRASTEAFFTFVQEHPYAWRTLFLDPPADPEIAAVHQRVHANARAAIAALFAAGPQLELSLPMPREQANELLAQALKSANDGLAAWWYEHPEVPRERLVAISIDLVWRGLAQIGGS
jgi:AcrR family transcriptional regulator